MELEDQKDSENVLGQFKFQKREPSQRVTRFAQRKKLQMDESLRDSSNTKESENSQMPPELGKFYEDRETPEKKAIEEKMPPPKSGQKSSKKKKGVESDSKRLKDELKEKQLDDVSMYLFNYLKEPQTNQVNKGSLKRCLRGLLIDNISEEQADIMLNYPNLDAKNIAKDTLNYEDFRLIVKECNFKFGLDGNLL